ncbi:hypothetical protein F6U93_12570 [Tamlana haliotis]|uniref:TolC family protein n=1 Tax=Pseudotamlana haliotis TaxID=2614804 RepID=A0A6N6ME77_9FLAO|nr:hypothetical protein [Tamlana haliotis]KAB1067246.1 hypothetical protein F6U93_12570 [Tamlana haliotis]
MKNNFYFILILLCFGSVVNAQNSEAIESVISKVAISELQPVQYAANQLKSRNIILKDELKIETSIVRLESDIRMYYKRQKKISNISLVFPKMNLEALAYNILD